MGMRGGFSLDFTVPDLDGYIWDFGKAECRARALKLVRTQKPHMLIGSLECTPFSALQNLNMRTPVGCAQLIEGRALGGAFELLQRLVCRADEWWSPFLA